MLTFDRPFIFDAAYVHLVTWSCMGTALPLGDTVIQPMPAPGTPGTRRLPTQARSQADHISCSGAIREEGVLKIVHIFSSVSSWILHKPHLL